MTTTDFSFLDAESVRSDFASEDVAPVANFYVGGISCAKCVRKLESLPARVPGLLSLNVDLHRKLARVEIDREHGSFERVARAIEQAGFTPVPLGAETEHERLARQESRLEMIRLAVAAACAGNIMTFSFANYFGAAGEWERYFSWLSFILYLPVVTFVAAPFYRGALTALRTRHMSIDLPMAVASLAGFAFSTYALVIGHGDIYFDSIAGFLFLILLSRAAQKGLQRKFLDPSGPLDSLDLKRVRVVNHGAWRWQSAREGTQPGTELLIKAGETLPVDGELKSERAEASLAWLTGEGDAKVFLKGAPLPAGARAISQEFHITVVRPLTESSYGRILSEVGSKALKGSLSIQKADRWAERLLMSVFVIAALFIFFYWPYAPIEAVRRAIALIVIACPCAMAFGTPLSLMAAIRRAQKAGLMVRDANVFIKALKIRTIFFDKTGTLTDTDLSLVEAPDQIPEEQKQILLSLENMSFHPIAFAFRKALSVSGPTALHVEDYKETPGEGVEGIIGAHRYRLERTNDSEQISCRLTQDDFELGRFHFVAEARSNSRLTLDYLRDQGFHLRLLSGDRSQAAETLGIELGFSAEDILSELSPNEKACIISQTPHAMMVGDGINDTLALMKADIGVAVNGGVEAAFKSSEMYLMEPTLEALPKFFAVSRSADHLVTRNLIISVIYNFTAGTCALLGWINPYAAALLMPISSGIILFSTWLGARK